METKQKKKEILEKQFSEAFEYLREKSAEARKFHPELAGYISRVERMTEKYLKLEYEKMLAKI